MLDLTQIFSAVCGQHLDHTWAPGGFFLPLCQRCTGLYSGAGIAVLALLWLKPKPTAHFLSVHAGFLLLMVPFGFHWLPQGPVLRSLTGVLFGFAVATFLWLPLKQSKAQAPLSSKDDWYKRFKHTCVYGLVLCVTLLTVPWIGSCGGKVSFTVLTLQGLWGAVALCTLILANACLAAMDVRKMLLPPARINAP